MKRNLLLLYSTFFILNSAFGQNPLVKHWDKRFGGTDEEAFHSFQKTTDGGYILGGFSLSGIGGDKTQAKWGIGDYWVVKLDSSGNKQWDKNFGGTNGEGLYSLQQTSDGGYILGGVSNSGISGDKTQAGWGNSDYWIVKIDSLGNKQWDKDFGGTDFDVLFSLQQTIDKGYILGGYSQSGIGGDKTQASQGGLDYWIIKVDSNGNKQWDKAFGGTDTDDLFSLQQTSDGGYILGGLSLSGAGGDKTQASWGGWDYWIIKTDSLGTKQWDKGFGGTGDDILYSLQQTSDGGYIFGGASTSGISGSKTQVSWGGYDYWIIKADSLGTKQWDKDFGGVNDEEAFGYISQTLDGGYLMSGSSNSNISGDKTENNLGPGQMWVVKTDSLGTKHWDKTIFNTANDVLGYARQTKDGCYVFAKNTIAGIGGYKTQPTQGGSDYWIVKFCDSITTAYPVANFISSDTTFCEEPIKCISFFDYSINNPLSWKWLFPGAVPSFSNQQNPINICYSQPGTYPVTLIVTNSAGTDTLTVSPMIRVGAIPPAPVITVLSGDTLICSPASSYQWYLNGVPISGATDSSYVAVNRGSYNVQITDSLGCSRLGSSVVASVNQFNVQSSEFNVYPNPVGDMFTVYSMQIMAGPAKLDIYNVLGEQVFSQFLLLNTQYLDIDVSALAKGIYFVLFSDGDKVYRTKFVKN